MESAGGLFHCIARGGAAGRRAEESETAAGILGAELYLEDLEDSRISEGDPTIGIVSAVVDSVRPTMIYTHSIQDVHQDHRNTHHAAMVAARVASLALAIASFSRERWMASTRTRTRSASWSAVKK